MNEGSRSLGVEGVLDPDRNLLLAHRIQRRRIHHLGAEVTEFGGLLVSQFVNDVGSLDDAGIGRHEAIDIGPNLQYRGVQGRCQDAGRIVGTAAAQGDDVPRPVPGNEAGNNGNGAVLPVAGELLRDQFIGPFKVHQPAVHPDEVQRIVQFGMLDGRRHDQGGKPFAVTENLVTGLLRQHLQQENAPADAVQLVQQGIHGQAEQFAVLAGTHQLIACIDMPFLERLQLFQIRGVRRFRERGDPDQFVRHPAQCRHHDDNDIVLCLYDGLDLQNAFRRGDRTAAEF